ncbi:hypothetical protein E2562_031703 [Oryza meyeriana var. granulata]|uniref:Uncharacterized protein n=1 Tax=Oryza meyeriana var. granulata TaxID=110450 RepID=A0A6G1E500_9ORYZ|nr:hypothetical protein E2562_031703 [Oryza meyeriana var. granulata]
MAASSACWQQLGVAEAKQGDGVFVSVGKGRRGSGALLFIEEGDEQPGDGEVVAKTNATIDGDSIFGIDGEKLMD